MYASPLAKGTNIYMNWVQIRFTLTATNHEALEDALLTAGALSITLEDNADQPILEPELHQTPVWDELKLTALFDATANTDKVLAELKHALGEALPPCKVEILEEKDWVREWMDQYHPIQLSEKLWICPSWRTPKDPNAINIMLDPGLAFGTGTHPTTALCLKALSTLPLKGKSVMDFGCGSGILAIAALKLGAASAMGIDIDPQALEATTANALKNGISPEQIPVSLPLEHYKKTYDVVIANILANPLMRLSDTISNLANDKGILLLSGLLINQAEDIINTYQQFNFEPIQLEEDWCCLIGYKA